MTTAKLHTALRKYGTVQMLKTGTVLTFLLTGKGLADGMTLTKIGMMVTEFAGDKYPIVECMKNEENFILIVLKPKQ